MLEDRPPILLAETGVGDADPGRPSNVHLRKYGWMVLGPFTALVLDRQLLAARTDPSRLGRHLGKNRNRYYLSTGCGGVLGGRGGRATF